MTPPHPSETNPSAWLADAAAHDPGRVFLRTAAGAVVTYGALVERTGRIAATLARLDVRAGDRVAVQVDKSPEAVLLYLGCLRLGAVLVPLNTAYTGPELEYFFGNAAPRLAVLRPADAGSLAPLAQRAGCARVETLGQHGDGSLLEAELRTTDAAPAATFDAGTLAALIYTSGTTGRSKGAMLTRGNLASNAAALARGWHFTADDVLLHALPLFHVHGLFVAINTVLAAAASLVLLPKFDAPDVLARLATATVFMGVPTHYTRLLQEPGLTRGSTANVRLFVSGSAPLLADTHREFERRTGHRILERYGMTETLMNTSNPYAGTRLPGSVGPPLQGVEVRVATADTGAGEAAPGTVGMLQIRGPNVFAGYWQDPEKTRESFTADGFFVSGDVGCIDDSGYVHLVGRAKDIVISGGYNVYPKEVESELDALPGVLESAVIGVPHPDLGEGVVALVVCERDVALAEAEVLRALQGRLARYKVPRRVLFVAELPRNAMGKVQKAVLRLAHAALFESD